MVSPQGIFVFGFRAPSRLAYEIPRFEFDRRRLGIEGHADGVAAGGQRLELVRQHAAEHHDAAIALAEMLFGMDGHRALADLGLIVARELLVLGLRHVPPELAVEFRAHPSDVAGIADATGDINAERGVVDRYGPANRFDACKLSDAGIWHDAQRGERGFGDAVEHLAVVL